MQVILLDIEGTTTPINFVYGTLFPYARKHLSEFLSENFSREDLVQLEMEYRQDEADSKPVWEMPPFAYLIWLMDEDRKSPALKSIQGKIWKSGFETGELNGELFPDVVPAMRRWKAQGKQVCIYSSGSVLAQKLLFRHSQAGDVTNLIHGYFDTEAGPKKESESYLEIARQLNCAASGILFISDVAAECAAAAKAGCEVRYSVRPGNKVEAVSFEQITTFEGVANS